ncbi:MAG: hypothetical protein Ct9H300mP27_04230 [Chloroflexota bacterium]|nr:MAG: hypothetical protein Ct9H300mP27_04230 [Chloroflexota bacterium]
MDINFEIGNPNRPKGHALAYFKVDTEPDYLYATYVVTLPIQADLTKYVPPFLASHLGNLPSMIFHRLLCLRSLSGLMLIRN